MMATCFAPSSTEILTLDHPICGSPGFSFTLYHRGVLRFDGSILLLFKYSVQKHNVLLRRAHPFEFGTDL